MARRDLSSVTRCAPPRADLAQPCARIVCRGRVRGSDPVSSGRQLDRPQVTCRGLTPDMSRPAVSGVTRRARPCADLAQPCARIVCRGRVRGSDPGSGAAELDRAGGEVDLAGGGRDGERQADSGAGVRARLEAQLDVADAVGLAEPAAQAVAPLRVLAAGEGQALERRLPAERPDGRETDPAGPSRTRTAPIGARAARPRGCGAACRRRAAAPRPSSRASPRCPPRSCRTRRRSRSPAEPRPRTRRRAGSRPPDRRPRRSRRRDRRGSRCGRRPRRSEADRATGTKPAGPSRSTRSRWSSWLPHRTMWSIPKNISRAGRRSRTRRHRVVRVREQAVAEHHRHPRRNERAVAELELHLARNPVVARLRLAQPRARPDRTRRGRRRRAAACPCHDSPLSVPQTSTSGAQRRSIASTSDCANASSTSVAVSIIRATRSPETRRRNRSAAGRASRARRANRTGRAGGGRRPQAPVRARGRC